MDKKIPVTLVSGSLGSGKTTIILNLVKQLPKDYKVVWLKNEYGDINIDSKLAKEESIRTAEVLNGCICCVLVGKLHSAIEEILERYSPDRIIIETAGTAYPFPVINQIDKFSNLNLDGVIEVIDAVNFEKFRDESYLAQMEARYVDLVVINKVEMVDDQALYEVEEYVYGLYLKTAKVKTKDGYVNKNLLIGLDSKLAEEKNLEELRVAFEKEDEHIHHSDEVEVFGFHSNKVFSLKEIEQVLKKYSNVFDSEIFRIKGIVKTVDSYKMLNWVCGRIVWSDLKNEYPETEITFMGRNILILKDEIVKELEGN